MYENPKLKLREFDFSLMVKLNHLNVSYPDSDDVQTLLMHLCAGRTEKNKLTINAIPSKYFKMSVDNLIMDDLLSKPKRTTCLKVNSNPAVENELLFDQTEQLNYNDSMASVSRTLNTTKEDVQYYDTTADSPYEVTRNNTDY